MKTAKGYAPIRTCISCGTKNNKVEMIRLVLDPDGVVIRDADGKGQGRGAYVCPNNACRQAMPTGNRLCRTFKKSGPIRIHPDIRFEFGC
jgi:uncharacterized protein